MHRMYPYVLYPDFFWSTPSQGILPRYLPRDKGLAEEAKKRFEHWLEAPDRQDVLPDDLKTSMFKILGLDTQFLD